MPDVVVPTDAQTDGTIELLQLVLLAKFAPSKSEGRRLIEQGGVSLDGNKITETAAKVAVVDGQVLKVGKRNFARIKAG